MSWEYYLPVPSCGTCLSAVFPMTELSESLFNAEEAMMGKFGVPQELSEVGYGLRRSAWAIGK